MSTEPQPHAARDERGEYAIFIAVIASALLVFGGIAYDAPRLITVRQQAALAANDVARVAAATVASGGTITEAKEAARDRLSRNRLSYRVPMHLVRLACVGSRVETTVVTSYRFQSAIGLFRQHHPVSAVGAAEAYLVLPNDAPSTLHHLGECPLS